MGDWIEWVNLALGIFGAGGILVLVSQWWIDNYAAHACAITDLRTGPISGDGSFFLVHLRVRNRVSYSADLFLVVESIVKEVGPVVSEQQIQIGPGMDPVAFVKVGPRERPIVKIRVTRVASAAGIRLVVFESRGGDRYYLPLDSPKRLWEHAPTMPVSRARRLLGWVRRRLGLDRDGWG